VARVLEKKRGELVDGVELVGIRAVPHDPHRAHQLNNMQKVLHLRESLDIVLPICTIPLEMMVPCPRTCPRLTCTYSVVAIWIMMNTQKPLT
jgi:hypothetical protein